MATLLLDRSQLEIRADGDALALYENSKRSGTIPIRLLERVVIQGSRTQLDSGVLIKLADAGIATLLVGARSSRKVAIVLGRAHNDASVRLAQTTRVMDDAFCRAWAKDLVAAKLHRQHRFLSKAEEGRPNARKTIFEAIATFKRIAAQLEGAEARNLDILRGLEGSAARAYFQGFTQLFPLALEFTGRNRRPPRDPVNACLSLAYTLLHFDAVRAAHTAGLDPLLGFYHRPAYGRESLASDLIEPLRPLADEWVWHQFRSRDLREDHFTIDKGACVLGKAGRERFYAAWERFATAPRRWLRVRCSQLARHLRTDGSMWLKDEEEEF